MKKISSEIIHFAKDIKHVIDVNGKLVNVYESMSESEIAGYDYDAEIDSEDIKKLTEEELEELEENLSDLINSMNNKELIQKELDEAIKSLNEKDENGEEVFSYYRDDLDYNEERAGETIAELIESADIDSTEFNIGFEQGYLRGLEVALSVVK